MNMSQTVSPPAEQISPVANSVFLIAGKKESNVASIPIIFLLLLGFNGLRRHLFFNIMGQVAKPLGKTCQDEFGFVELAGC